MKKSIIAMLLAVALTSCFDSSSSKIIDGEWIAVDTGCALNSNSEIAGYYYFEDGLIKNSGINKKLEITELQTEYTAPSCVGGEQTQALKVSTGPLDLIISVYEQQQGKQIVVHEAFLFGEAIPEQTQVVYHQYDAYLNSVKGNSDAGLEL